MASASDFSQAIGCLSTVFPEFLAIEISRLVDEIVSATQAITDPLSELANTSAQGLVDDVASLTEGNMMENIAAGAAGLFGSYALREVNERLSEMYWAQAGIKAFQQSRNVAEQVYANAMIMFSVFKEAPYAVAQTICRRIIRLCDKKLEQLQCLKKNVIRMNNTVAVLATAKNQIVNFENELRRLSAELDAARRDLRLSIAGSFTQGYTFDEAALARGVQNLKDADAILDPQSSDVNLLDVANILTSGTTSNEHITESNIKLAAMIMPHTSYMLEAQVGAVQSWTDAINFQIASVVGVLNSFRSSAVQTRSKDIRARSIQELISRVSDMKESVDSAIASGDSRGQTAWSLLWSSRLKSMVAVGDRIQSANFEPGSSEGDTKAETLNSAYENLIGQIEQIDSANVINGIHDVTQLKTKVTALRKSGTTLLRRLDERPVTSEDMLNFTVLVAETATGGNNLIEEGITATYQLKDACEDFLSVDIGFTEDLNKLRTLFDAMGFDRGRDMIDSGQFAEFFDSNLDQLSYLQTAISCLGRTIGAIDDVGTKAEVAALRDELQSRRANELLSAADSLNFGGKKLLDRAKYELDRFEKKKKTVEGLVEKIKSAAAAAGLAVEELGQGYNAMKTNLERLEIDAEGRLSADFDEFIKRPRAGVPLCS